MMMKKSLVTAVVGAFIAGAVVMPAVAHKSEAKKHCHMAHGKKVCATTKHYVHKDGKTRTNVDVTTQPVSHQPAADK